MRFTVMIHASTLLIDRDGHQIVRAPRRWDAIGALLQRVYAVRRAIPDPLARLLPGLDAIGDHAPDGLSARR